jgi:thioredoxin 1
MSSLLEIDKESFKGQVLESDTLVLVDFWAEWCGPCRMIAPVLEKLQESYGDKVKIVKVNVDENSELAGEYGVQSIPNLLVFKGGEKVDSSIGASGEETLRKLIDKSL